MYQQKNLIKMLIVLCFLTFPVQLTAMFQYAQPKETIKKAKIQKVKASSKQCFDLMMILDTFGDEEIDSENQTMGRDLVSSLIQKNFPIIVSRNLVYNVCAQATHYSLKDPLVRQTIPRELLSVKPLLYSIDLTDNDWYCYDHPQADIMLFIPKNYTAQFSDISGINDTEHMQQCGFNTINLTKIEEFSPKTLATYIQEKNRSLQKTSIIQAIESMFIIPNKSDLPTWNIYVTGHGKTHFAIAGLKPADFMKLLACFQKINCSFLHYCSCYSGGYNQTIVQNQLSKLNVNFIVSSQGINEEITYGSKITSSLTSAAFTNFFNITESFFGNPVAFAQTQNIPQSWQKDPIASIVSTVINKKILDFSQPFVYIPAVGIFNAITVDKSVKIVTEAITKAHEFENKTMDFTNPAIETIIIYPHYIGIPLKIKAHTAIVSPTTAQDMDIHIFTEIIYQDTLSSMLSNCISFNKKLSTTVLAIKKLQCFDYHHSGLGNDYKNLISIENMILQISSIERGNMNVSAVFNFNKKIYWLDIFFKSDALRESNQIIVETFKKLPAQESSQVRLLDALGDPLYDFTSSAVQDYLREKKLLSPVNTNRTLADVIDILESTIDTTTHVQEPGSLKRVLLQKQQQILGKEAHESEKTKQQKLLKASKPPQSKKSSSPYKKQR